MRATVSFSIAILAYGSSLYAQELTPDLDAPTAPKKDSSEIAVRVYEQAPPKPLGALPDGWRLEKLTGHLTKQPPVTLPNGESTNITTSAYALVPEPSPGSIVFVDPGFNSTQGNAQKKTIGAVLTDHVESATTLNTRLNDAIGALKEALLRTKAEPAPTTTTPAADTSAPKKPVRQPRRDATAPTPIPAATAAPVAQSINLFSHGSKSEKR